MQVLVGGDALEHPVSDRVIAGLAGVPMGDAGRELLEGHVGDGLQDAGRTLAVVELVARSPAAAIDE